MTSAGGTAYRINISKGSDLNCRSLQFVEKVCFFKKVLVLNPYPQTPFPGKGAILLGLPPLVPVGGYAPATPFLSTIEVFRQSEVSDLNCRSLFAIHKCS